MLKTIKDNKIDNTIFLAGDSHAAWLVPLQGHSVFASKS